MLHALLESTDTEINETPTELPSVEEVVEEEIAKEETTEDLSSEETASELSMRASVFMNMNARLNRTLRHFDQFTYSVNTLERTKLTIDKYGYTESLNRFLNSEGELAEALGLDPDKELTVETFNESYLGDTLIKIWDMLVGFIRELGDNLKNFFKSFFNFQDKVDNDVKQKLDVIKKADSKIVEEAMTIPSHRGFIHYRDFNNAIRGLVKILGDIGDIDLKDFQRYIDDVIAGKSAAEVDLVGTKYLGADYEKRLKDIGITLLEGGAKSEYVSVFAKANAEHRLKDLNYNQASIETVEELCARQLRQVTNNAQKLISGLENIQKQLQKYKTTNTTDDAARKLLTTIPDQTMALISLTRRCVVVAGEYQAKRQELVDAVYYAVAKTNDPVS